jgi:hypothetical protein
VIITRRNDRRLRITATDWVKNGDRWTVLHVAQDGALKVRHRQNGRPVTLPPGYVGTAAELGYATTVHGAQGVTVVHTAAQQLELDTAGDPAAVLDWRLDDTRLHNSPAPLPWLPGIPDRIANSPEWGPYLAARAQLITDLADQVRAYSEAPTWAAEHDRVLPPDLITDLQVWRAAMQVEPADLRPTGPEQRSVLARTWQHRLNRRLGTHDTPQDQQWAELLAEQIPNLINDSFLPSLTNRLQNLDRAGLDTISLVQSATAKAPLPDDHPAAALWWRILDELPIRLPNHPDHRPPPGAPAPGATRHRQQPYRAPKTPPSTIGPSR